MYIYLFIYIYIYLYIYIYIHTQQMALFHLNKSKIAQDCGIRRKRYHLAGLKIYGLRTKNRKQICYVKPSA